MYLLTHCKQLSFQYLYSSKAFCTDDLYVHDMYRLRPCCHYAGSRQTLHTMCLAILSSVWCLKLPSLSILLVAMRTDLSLFIGPLLEMMNISIFDGCAFQRTRLVPFKCCQISFKCYEFVWFIYRKFLCKGLQQYSCPRVYPTDRRKCK